MPERPPLHAGQSCRIRVIPGAGGEDAKHWALAVTYMLVEWGRSHGLAVEMNGPREFTATGSGAPDAYGQEAGVHRLVRNSPFDAQRRRTSTFAAVEVEDDAGDHHDMTPFARSYVLDPYELAKDHRTGAETGNVRAVLAGDLTALVNA